MRDYIYGVEKVDGDWVVWRFSAEDSRDAVRWVNRAANCGSARWLCDRKTAAEMAGEKRLEAEYLIIWEG